jgi:hypothetical protein
MADFCLHRLTYVFGAIAVIFYVWGLSQTKEKNKVIDQIRLECGIKPKRSVVLIAFEALRRKALRFLPEEYWEEPTTKQISR